MKDLEKELSFGTEKYRITYSSLDVLWEDVRNHEFINDLKQITV